MLILSYLELYSLYNYNGLGWKSKEKKLHYIIEIFALHLWGADGGWKRMFFC
jgi:hypothetical protein